MRTLVISIMLILLTVCLSIAASDNDYENALINYRNKNYIEAVSLLNKVISKNPSPSAYYLKGYALYKLKRNNEAQRNFKEAFFLDPKFDVDEFIRKVYGRDKISKNE